MDTDYQYKEDCTKLAGLVERFTGIPKKRVFDFVKDNSASDLLPFANMVCKTDSQRVKLAALFEFKNLYETIKCAEKSQEYILDSATAAKGYFKSYYADLNDKERFSITFLDAQLKVIATKTMFTGTINESPVHPRELIKEALFYNAVSIMLSHNHPSGYSTPSQQDLLVTRRVREVMDAANIQLLDHIIVARDDALSLADRGDIRAIETAQIQSKAATPVREPQAKKPSIKQQLKEAGEQLATELSESPTRAAPKTKSKEMGI
jgi:DNA repair protein RadC